MKVRVWLRAVVFLGLTCGGAANADVYTLGGDRFLFLDGFLLDTVQHAHLTVHGGRELGGVFRVEQRIDGFISLDFDYEGGSAVTAPLTFAGNRLSLNINTSASGEARVAVLDADGKETDGYSLAEARYINGDYVDKTVEWRDGNADVARLACQPVRLRFECRGTKLYSFCFKE